MIVARRITKNAAHNCCNAVSQTSFVSDSSSYTPLPLLSLSLFIPCGSLALSLLNVVVRWITRLERAL